ncbi:MAG: hypothetical protein EHM32_06025 [Spirochaetales bacterium]|nr:MAG: hypothetical protein EHM32_06025 [Spirochaetales bacterium]
MIINLLAGMITGFVVALPPLGPIAFAVIGKGFKNEISEGRAIALGAAFMDFFYCLRVHRNALIISFFPSGIADFYSSNARIVELGLTFAGCVIVALSGRKILKKKITFDKLEADESSKVDSAYTRARILREKTEKTAKHLKIPIIKKSNSFGLVLSGVLLALSSIAMPAAWIAIVGYLKGFQFLQSSILGGLVFSMGVFSGSFAWYFALLKLITGNKKRIHPTTINTLNVIAGVILLTLSGILFVKAIVSGLKMI